MSFAAHAAMLGAAVVLTHRVAPTQPAARDFFPVEYLVPEEKRVGMRPHEEHVAWLTVDAGAGLGFREAASPPHADEQRLTVVLAKGEETEIQADDKPPAPQAPITPGDSILTELEVDSTVMRYPGSAAPAYPPALLARRVEGSVLVQYIVDATGRPDSASLRVLYASHAEFAKAVRHAIPLMRFRPAYVASRPVAQLVEQPFSFRLVDSTRVPTKPPSA